MLDRDGDLLRGYLTSEGRWRLPATRADVDPRFLEALLAYEDKRFFAHRGVDPLAMMRAAYQQLGKLNRQVFQQRFVGRQVKNQKQDLKQSLKDGATFVNSKAAVQNLFALKCSRHQPWKRPI
mgnify:CR=1 FL=1